MTHVRQTVAILRADQLTAHPDNVREDLGPLEEMALSIRELGIIEPLIATEHPEHSPDHDVFVLLDGHRRFKAGLEVGLAAFPAIVRHGVDGAVEQTITMLATDVHKKVYTPMERANAYQSLRNRGLSGSEIARRVGVSPSTVTNYLNLLRLDPVIARKVEAGDVSVSSAASLVAHVRQDERRQAGRPERGRRTGHFTRDHPLAPAVAELCTHTGLLGGVGCGPCWEAVIRADAVRVAGLAAARAS